MIKLEKLYSEPELFNPILFSYGVNIIMGEKSESDNKKIGVGKSICVEFINFCLLKRFSESRLSHIPKGIVEPDVKICLDLLFNNHKITIIRTFGEQDKVVIFKDSIEIIFEKIDDATEFMTSLYFEQYPPYVTRISFRNILSPVIRDERSEFKDIIKTFDTSKLIPRDYKPHLFFLGLDVGLYSEIGRVIADIEKLNTYLSETRKFLTNNGEVKISDAKARLNELESEVVKITTSLEQLKNKESFDIIQADIIRFESEIKSLRTKQSAINLEIKQIESFPQPENISENELGALFNEFKFGLGDMVVKSIEQVKFFKSKIDSFRNALVSSRLDSLKEERSTLNKSLNSLDEEYANKLSLIDDGGALRDLKTSLSIFNTKSEERDLLKHSLERYQTSERKKKLFQIDKLSLIAKLDQAILDSQNIINSFQATILDIHEEIMGNKEAYFEVKTNGNKDIVEFVLRTDDDGSHTTERIKVFIYDCALMFNEITRKNHPGFLIHDNLFDKDDDTLEKSLNFLYLQEQCMPDGFQYILTLNRDLVEPIAQKGDLLFSVDNYKRASFTKEARFLKSVDKYTETKKKK